MSSGTHSWLKTQRHCLTVITVCVLASRELKYGGGHRGDKATGSGLAAALLEGVLQAQDDGGADSAFPFLIVSSPLLLTVSHQQL